MCHPPKSIFFGQKLVHREGVIAPAPCMHTHASKVPSKFQIEKTRTSFTAHPTLRYGQSRTCAPLTSLLSAAEAPQPLVCAIRAWSRPADRQATRTPPACASALRRLEGLVLPRGPAPALARRRCQHGAGSRRQWRSSTPCSAGPGCLTSSSHCSHRGAATPMIVSERVAT